LLEAAKTVFGTSGVDAPAKQIADLAANLCVPVPGEGVAYSQRMVALLIDGLRHGAGAQSTATSPRRNSM
ncbi:MAG: hypothetical protein WBF20_09945, partial [Trebonia sp.]|uniref:hypothetical protein n=1 Tax=Trebonia sp. TaxID=2767075 RepID=UPI003C721806